MAEKDAVTPRSILSWALVGERPYDQAKAILDKIRSKGWTVAQMDRPHPEDAPLVAVHEAAWEDAQEAECKIPELEDALANSNAYAQRLPDRIADFLLTYSAGGDPLDPWQVGHNYAMREAARMVREKWFDLDGAVPSAPDDASGLDGGERS